MNQLYLVIGLFGLGALLGMYLLSLVLQKKETHKSIAMLHGIFVAVALVLLIAYACRQGPGLMEAIVLFIMAALGGIVLIFRDLTGRSLPRWLAVTHGLLAVAGFIFLLLYAFRQN